MKKNKSIKRFSITIIFDILLSFDLTNIIVSLDIIRSSSWIISSIFTIICVSSSYKSWERSSKNSKLSKISQLEKKSKTRLLCLHNFYRIFWFVETRILADLIRDCLNSSLYIVCCQTRNFSKNTWANTRK